MVGRSPMTTEERFWEKVDKSAGPDGCWLWTASRNENGYGRFSVGRPRGWKQAQRVSLEMALGYELASNVFACHTCDNPPCVNPAHLYAGTPKQNTRDMEERGRGYWSKRTHCDEGHEYTPENTYFHAALNCRVCRTCRRVTEKRYRDRKRAERDAA